jgi:hypothetical protein
LTYFTVPACTSFSDRLSSGGSSESIGERSSNTRRARDTRARAWTLNTTIHNCKVTQCAAAHVQRTDGDSMGTRKKTKERLGGCQAARAVVWRARRTGAPGRPGRRVPTNRRKNITRPER